MDDEPPPGATIPDRLSAIDRRVSALEARPGRRVAGRMAEVRRARRRFTLLDAMIVVAFAALGALPCRVVAGAIGDVSWGGTSRENLMTALIWFKVVTTPIALAASAATFALRLNQPRPALARVLRQPGAIAMGVATLGALVILAETLLFGVLADHMDGDVVLMSLYYGSALIGMVVVGVRVGLALGGRRRPVADWVDGLGRGLSWFWMITGPVLLFIA